MDSANACGVLGRGIEALRARFLEDAEPVVIVIDYNVIALWQQLWSIRLTVNGLEIGSIGFDAKFMGLRYFFVVAFTTLSMLDIQYITYRTY